MLGQIAAFFRSATETTSDKPPKPARNATSDYSIDMVLAYANTLRNGQQPHEVMTTKFAEVMANRKGWNAERLASIKAYFKALGFHTKVLDGNLYMVDYDAGILVGVSGDPYGVLDSLSRCTLDFRSVVQDEPAYLGTLSVIGDGYRTEDAEKFLSTYTEKLKWYRKNHQPRRR